MRTRRMRVLLWVLGGVALLAVGWHFHRPLLRAVGPHPERYFTAHIYRDAHSETMPYRLMPPIDSVAGQRYPLVVLLHGSAECGRDNLAQLDHLAPAFVDPVVRRAFPSYLVAPQCPPMEDWGTAGPVSTRNRTLLPPSEGQRLLLGLLDELQATYPIDPDRIYLIGFSMGAHGVWDLITRDPSRYAAAVPIAGTGEPWRAPRITHVPVWVFHGTHDRVVPVGDSRAMIAALRAVGSSPRYTEYPNAGHLCWSQAMQEPTFMAWLFTQRRKAPAE